MIRRGNKTIICGLAATGLLPAVCFAASISFPLTNTGPEVVTSGSTVVLEVRAAYDGEEALQSISDEPPQVIVLDVKMPGLGGIEVLKRVRSDYPRIPVILLTGLGSTEEGTQGMQLGAVDYLMKPVEIEALIEKIEEALKSSSMES